MTPFYFGSSSQPLFGVYHAPNGKIETNLGIVVCYPAGHEYFRVHRMLCQSAMRWSQSGIHVLRFDYFATGDSSGDFSDASYARWCDDVANAIMELKAVSGARNIALVGCRLGANIALNVSGRDKNVRSVVCWDPIIDTNQYLSELDNLNHCMLIDPDRFLTERIAENNRELLGFEYSSTFREQLENNSQSIDHLQSKYLSVCLSADFEDEVGQFFKDDSNKIEFTTERLTILSQWDEVTEIESLIKSANFADIVTKMVVS